jgi:phosphatidate cytidylyltransferase
MKRVFTAAVGIPVVLLITVMGPEWLFTLLVSSAAALALEEFLTLGAARGMSRPGRWFLPLGAGLTASFGSGPFWLLAAILAAVLALMTVALFDGPLTGALERVALGIAGLIYCCFLPGFLMLLTRDFVLVLLAIVWVGDSAAYYAGRNLGRRPLAPQISPKKTVEGAVAGLAGSVAAGVFMAGWLAGETWFPAALFSGVTAIAGQIGDLSESALKRSAGVKDSSSILPGHGGILDRLDSLFFAAPVLYCLLQVMNA